MSNIDTAQNLIDAFNGRDWDAVMQHLTDGVTYDEVGTGRVINGADGWIGANKAWVGAFSNARGEITNTTESGNTVLLEVTWTGTHDGEMLTPKGPVPATNKDQTTRACIVYEFEDGKVARARHYFDVASMMAQLGLA